MKKKLFLDKELITSGSNSWALDGGSPISTNASQCVFSVCPNCQTMTHCPSGCPTWCPDETE